MPDCRDKSDEVGCELIVLENNYNKYLPPIGRNKSGRLENGRWIQTKDGGAIPVNVNISITLMKVVEIEEIDHSIHLQFQISLKWKENDRVTYQNLKDDTTLNALSFTDMTNIWLPLVVYDNTDQKEVTRLGVDWEWVTTVAVTREEKPRKSGLDEIDEVEYFEGAKNWLTMNQTYTHEFQCQYKLQRYPFDTQVFDNHVIL